MEDGPQNINCDTAKTKYVQKENLLSMIYIGFCDIDCVELI